MSAADSPAPSSVVPVPQPRTTPPAEAGDRSTKAPPDDLSARELEQYHKAGDTVIIESPFLVHPA